MNHYWQQSTYRPTTVGSSRVSKLIRQKYFWELIILFLLIGGSGELLLCHNFFKVHDVQIIGLDGRATDLARTTINTYLNSGWGGWRHNNYYLLDTQVLTNNLTRTIATDEISVTKIFPHTLRAQITELPIRAAVEFDNTIALVSADGEVVRLATTSTAQARLVPWIYCGGFASSTAVRAQIISSERLQIAQQIFSLAAQINSPQVALIFLPNNDLERAELRLQSGKRVIFKPTADLNAQIKKAGAAAAKYPLAKSIDVRFADRAYVSF